MVSNVDAVKIQGGNGGYRNGSMRNPAALPATQETDLKAGRQDLKQKALMRRLYAIDRRRLGWPGGL